jgi:hypothetical protein
MVQYIALSVFISPNRLSFEGTGGQQQMFSDANNTTIYGGTFNIGPSFENGKPII